MPDDALFPGTAELAAWIETIVGQGIRRPGYPADQWAEQWIAERLRACGVPDVAFEPVPLPAWLPESARLRVRSANGESAEFEGFPLPYTAPARDLTARLTRQGDPDAAGTLVVDELGLDAIPQRLIREMATSCHDPLGEFDELVQVVPLGPRGPLVMEPAMEAGAAGFIGALTGMPWETRDYYLPYDAVRRPVPGVWLSPADSARLLALMDSGPCVGQLTVEARIEPTTSHNVVGVLPGASPHTVIVASHHDAPWASAVEDASGICLVLAVASYFAALPAQDRPHSLVFLLTAGHMAGAAGTRAFIDQHRALLADTVLEVHLEHAALRCEARDGALVPTTDPEVRWWFTSQSPVLEGLVSDALAAEDLRRSLVLRPDLFSPMPPTDGAYFHPEGVPLVHFLSAPMYLFDSADTVDKVDLASMIPLARAAVRVIEGTAGLTPEGVRSSVRIPGTGALLQRLAGDGGRTAAADEPRDGGPDQRHADDEQAEVAPRHRAEGHQQVSVRPREHRQAR
jgi:hypothetical protein